MKTTARGVPLALGLALLAGSAAAGETERQLFTITFPSGVEPAAVPIRLAHRLSARDGVLTELDVRGRPAAAIPAWFAGQGEMTALVPSQSAGRRRTFWLSAGAPPAGPPQVRLQPAEDAGAPLLLLARTYEAQIDPSRGGLLASLTWLGPDGRRVETLGPGGMSWTWTGSPGRSDQAAQGATPVEVVENGSARLVLRATAADVLGAGNTFTVTSCFYPECVDQHYEFDSKTTFQTSALKLWCFLSPQGDRLQRQDAGRDGRCGRVVVLGLLVGADPAVHERALGWSVRGGCWGWPGRGGAAPHLDISPGVSRPL